MSATQPETELRRGLATAKAWLLLATMSNFGVVANCDGLEFLTAVDDTDQA